jgi:spore germination cell wall hydrolase CwlJ-like protein
MLTTAGALCLSLNVFFEARSEPVIGQLAVIEVTMNRVESGRYPDTVCEVVWQNKQFSWTHDGVHDDPTRMSYLDQIAWENSQAIVEGYINGEVDITSSGATMYHANYVFPYWTSSYELVAIVGTHIFYK